MSGEGEWWLGDKWERMGSCFVGYYESDMEKSGIKSYKDLLVWQEGMQIAQACYQITKEFPKEEIYGMTSQIRRCAVSIPANVAEGYGREYPSQFIQFLRIAQGSLKELETHLLLAIRVEITTTQKIKPILNNCESLGRMLRSLIRSLQKKQSVGIE